MWLPTVTVVVDLVTTKRGEMFILHQLAASFLNCDKAKQARKIMTVGDRVGAIPSLARWSRTDVTDGLWLFFQTPGLRANMTALKNICDRFIEKGQVGVNRATRPTLLLGLVLQQVVFASCFNFHLVSLGARRLKGQYLIWGKKWT